MNAPSPKRELKLLSRLRRVFSGLSRCTLLRLRDAYRLVDDQVRVPYEGFPIEILLGGQGQRLHLYPEYPLQGKSGASDPPSFLLVDPDHKGGPIVPFLRLSPGDKLVLGSKSSEQTALFGFGSGVEPRHLQLIHDGDSVVFEDLTSIGTCISPALDEETGERLGALRRLEEIFGGPFEPLPPDQALDTLRAVLELMREECCRPKDTRGLPGGMLELRPELTPVLVADMHAQIDNLLSLLTHSGILAALESGKACLVIIGDAVHSEQDGQLDRMEDSMLIMDLIFRLKLRFPEQVFYVRGNHDSFSEEISKGGIPQGMLWARALKEARGKKYRNAMQAYYDALPYLVVGAGFVSTHAAPPRSKVSPDMLVDIQRYPGLIPELNSNRMARPNRPGGYTKGDVRRLRKSLGLSPDTSFIVGHTPMDQEHTYWLNVGGAEQHHILYSADTRWVGAFIGFGGRMYPVRFPVEPLRGLLGELSTDST